MLLTDQVHLFARIAAADRVVFGQLMTAAIASQTSPLPDPTKAAWEGLMDQWWNRVCLLPPKAAKHV